MHDRLDPLLKNLPPRTASAFTRAINKCGAQLGIGPDWVQRWIGFTVVADALARHTPDGEPAFHFKGGAAIEMRMRQLEPIAGESPKGASSVVRPRATKDLDATYRGALEEVERAVREALSTPHHHFAFRIESETPDAPHMRRFDVRVTCRVERFGRIVEEPFTRLKLEVSAYEGTVLRPDMVPAFSLKPFGLEGPDSLPCIPLVKQIAQKLHAVTEMPAEGKTNDRFRDLLDIVMLSALVPPSAELRAVCEETFHVRQQHGWPPQIVTYPHWIDAMEKRAGEMGLDHRSAAEIKEYVVAYVRAIAAA